MRALRPLFLAMVMAATAGRALGLDASANAALARGEAWADVVPDGHGAAVIRAAVDIPRPARLVWRVMTGCAYAARLVSTLTSCRVLKADPRGAWDIREQVTKGGLFFPPIHNVFRSDYTPFSEIRFHKIGGDLAVEEGVWRLESLANGAGVRVTYLNHVGARLIAPAFLVRMGMKASTPRVMMNLKRVCLSLPAAAS